MKKMQNLLLNLLALAAVVLTLVGCSDQPTGLSVDDAYVRMPPPGMKMTAGFATLTNSGSKPVTLMGASSPGFSSVSLHRTQIEDGVAKMREVESVVIDPSESLVLKPGGYHLMLMGSGQALETEGRVDVVLMFADGSEQSIVFPVQER